MPLTAEVHHIGSTAVEGIGAKPIIDLLLVFPALGDFGSARRDIESLGYEWRGENGIPGRRYCTLANTLTGERMVHLHGFPSGATEIAHHLGFRDFLRTHSQVAADYERAKRCCAASHPHDARAYSECKKRWFVLAQTRYPLLFG